MMPSQLLSSPSQISSAHVHVQTPSPSVSIWQFQPGRQSAIVLKQSTVQPVCGQSGGGLPSGTAGPPSPRPWVYPQIPLEHIWGDEHGCPMSLGCWFLQTLSGLQKALGLHCAGGAQQGWSMSPHAPSPWALASFVPPSLTLIWMGVLLAHDKLAVERMTPTPQMDARDSHAIRLGFIASS